MFEDLDFNPGKITYSDFGIDPNLPLDEEDDSLKEDMFQVEYPLGYAIDVGWYSGIKRFIVFLIKDCNWEEPITRIECHDLDDLNDKVKETIETVKNLLEEHF